MSEADQDTHWSGNESFISSEDESSPSEAESCSSEDLSSSSDDESLESDVTDEDDREQDRKQEARAREPQSKQEREKRKKYRWKWRVDRKQERMREHEDRKQKRLQQREERKQKRKQDRAERLQAREQEREEREDYREQDREDRMEERKEERKQEREIRRQIAINNLRFLGHTSYELMLPRSDGLNQTRIERSSDGALRCVPFRWSSWDRLPIEVRSIIIKYLLDSWKDEYNEGCICHDLYGNHNVFKKQLNILCSVSVGFGCDDSLLPLKRLGKTVEEEKEVAARERDAAGACAHGTPASLPNFLRWITASNILLCVQDTIRKLERRALMRNMDDMGINERWKDVAKVFLRGVDDTGVEEGREEVVAAALGIEL